jgi:Flp pilus assembly protein protease CpaA
MIWLFIFVLAVSTYDIGTHRIPNGCTLPLIVLGVVVHFPGTIETWLATALLICAWAGAWMGAGDAKLWIALLWAMPTPYSSHAWYLMFISFLVTGTFQIFWRIFRERTPVKALAPAAWRTIPFILWCWYVH